MRLKKKQKIRPARTEWLHTFADLLLLLLTFFIMLFAMKTLEKERLQEAFSFFVQEKAVEEREEGGLAGALSLRLRRELAALPAGIAKTLHLEESAENLRLTLESDGIFDAGAIALRPEAPLFLQAVSDIFRPLGAMVLVQGYPDTGMEGEPAAALAMERAVEVRRYLVEQAGLAADTMGIALDRKYPALYAGEDSRQRAWNRRVTFLILEDGDVR
ncbi:flagellar motor protein MotB [Desulfobotulus alkaliphilus]|uniref:Flagellar motor protein MotB n=1 Tax=Desulfobotulus alkaliphilus TaxID=622671 RepID=A0A562RVG6_9BACT|nr:flagellar motor protein MotB [Desulfobotulus alkaliphilus]TWI72410.1 flagellar motor protein MotB [Desulfobotulus alkaliphilus]